MECPVCKTSTTDTACKRCHVCDTDLEIFRLIDKLERKAIAQKRRSALLSVFLFMTILGAGSYYTYIFVHRHDQQMAVSQSIRQQQIEIQNLTNEKQLLMTNIIELRREVQQLTERLQEAESISEQSNVPTRPAYKEVVHVVKRGENLKLIAQKYYGDSEAYQRIMIDNNIQNPNHITVNQRLRITVPAND